MITKVIFSIITKTKIFFTFWVKTVFRKCLNSLIWNTTEFQFANLRKNRKQTLYLCILTMGVILTIIWCKTTYQKILKSVNTQSSKIQLKFNLLYKENSHPKKKKTKIKFWIWVFLTILKTENREFSFTNKINTKWKTITFTWFSKTQEIFSLTLSNQSVNLFLFLKNSAKLKWKN